MKSELPSFFLNKPPRRSVDSAGAVLRTSFLDKGIHHLAGLIKTTYSQWETANKNGFFQKLDARVKVVFLLFFVIIVSLKRAILPEAIIGGFTFTLVALSRLNLLSFYRRVIFFSFLFGFLIALPSSLNIVTRGEIVIPLFHLSQPYDFWIYHVPESVGITRTGIHAVALLTLRVANSLSLSFLVVYTTPFAEIIRALKSLKVPDPLLMIITLSYKYIFIFAKTLEDIHLATKSKVVEVSDAQARKWVAGRIAFLFRKTRIRCEEVFNAMLARGFTGEISLFAQRKMRKRDLVIGSFLLVIGSLLLAS
ncbi:MAG TPA: hypothetical protein DCP92_01580 [Nitrospiraceae bacterium]|jgi:cobalt ECF transporter T component CbiQ|nr:hypothetical protein [Nitrospiraceae bacterium]